MFKLFKALVLAAFVTSLSAAALAADHGTLDDAKAMVKKARTYLREQGPDKAYAEFSNPKGKFVDRDIYIYVYDKTGKNLAHGANAKLIGKDLSEMKDTDGVYVIKGLLKVAASGGGTFPYRWANPITKGIDNKIGYAEMEGDVMVGSGIYGK
jgi:cytochrome c